MTTREKVILSIGIAVAVGLIILNRKRIMKAGEQVVDIILSAEQEAYIKKLHPSAQPIFRAFIKDVTDRGYKVIINSGYRSFEEQYKQWVAGLSDADKARVKAGKEPLEKSQNAVPGHSGHNYGMAIDMNIAIVKDGKLKTYMKGDTDATWNETGIPQLAKTKYGMKWGGDYNTYQDAVHFDLSEHFGGTDKLYQAAVKQFGKVRDIRGNELKLAA